MKNYMFRIATNDSSFALVRAALRIIMSLACCWLISSCSTPRKTTVDHLVRMDSNVLEDLRYIGSTNERHYFANHAYGLSIYWVPVSDLKLKNTSAYSRQNTNGPPARLASQKHSIAINNDNVRIRSIEIDLSNVGQVRTLSKSENNRKR